MDGKVEAKLWPRTVVAEKQFPNNRYTFLRPEQEPVRVPAPYANTLGLVAGAEYDPEDVLEKMLKLDPKASVTVQDLIRAFGVRKKG